MHICAQQVVVDNGLIKRGVDTSNGHIVTSHYVLQANDMGFLNGGSNEFSFLVNGTFYSGRSEWTDIRSREVETADGGKGVLVSFKDRAGAFAVDLTYMAYPGLPLVRKTLKVTNLGNEELKLEAVNVEDVSMSLNPVESRVMHKYARYKTFSSYIGNWEDPLIVVHDTNRERGMAIGNEDIGVLKLTSVFTDGSKMTAGMTHPGQPYAFRRWLGKGFPFQVRQAVCGEVLKNKVLA